MLSSTHTRDGDEAVRFVSGMAALPAWIRDLDGISLELGAVAVLIGLVVLVWLW
jgi:hypothetical protein